MDVLEGESEIILNAEEHAALVRNLTVKQEMKDPRQHIYFCGHTDGYAYLKEIGVV
jgi:hypothetical protein